VAWWGGTSSCRCRVVALRGELWLSGRLAIGGTERCDGGARRDASAGMGGGHLFCFLSEGKVYGSWNKQIDALIYARGRLGSAWFCHRVSVAKSLHGSREGLAFG
jgi:hypothetical protein